MASMVCWEVNVPRVEVTTVVNTEAVGEEKLSPTSTCNDHATAELTIGRKTHLDYLAPVGSN